MANHLTLKGRPSVVAALYSPSKKQFGLFRSKPLFAQTKRQLRGYQADVRSWIAIIVASVTGSGVASSQVVMASV